MVDSGISSKVLIAIFLLKVAAGSVNGWVMFNYSNGTSDSWAYHIHALDEYHLLFIDPKTYALNIFQSGNSKGYAALFQSHGSYWNDMKDNLIIKLLSIFDVFSRGNYYINVIFFNFMVLFGNVGIYKVFAQIYKHKEKTLLLSCFLLPSFLFFSSSIHKEGLIVFAVGVVIYKLYHAFDQKRIGFGSLFITIFCLGFIFLQRNFVLLAMLPALLAWMVCIITQYKPLKIFAGIYIVGLIIFFATGKASSFNLPVFIVKKQAAFFELKKANSFVDTDTLYPNFISFVRNAPQAINHSMMRPYLPQKKNVYFLYPFAIEILIYNIIILLFFFFREQNDSMTGDNMAFILFGLFFSCTLLMVIGYTIPIIGAIIRYRSVYLPFLLTPFLCNIDWNAISSRINYKNK
ncbi:MAG: hypothetical protein HY305_07560 [Sphingobacteriales bacterium]|nr:hypothetical protein [Sphingobacteriales bacterium]